MGSDTFELQRTDSICPPPELQLLEYVKSNQVEKIESLTASNPEILSALIGHPFNKPILYIACYELAEKVNIQTVETLLNLGADLHYSQEIHDHKEAVHFAALGCNPKILTAIVKRLEGDQINSLSGNNTALNLLIKEGNSDHPKFVECVRILVQAGADVNKSDGKNLTPVFWAAKKGYKDVAKIILHESQQEVDLDNHKLRGKSARDFITENNWTDLYDNLPLKTNANNNIAGNTSDILFGFLKDFDEDAFVSYKYLSNFVEVDNGMVTLLQMATKKGLSNAVETLLNYGADPNKATLKTRMSPIELAAVEGYHEIFNLLLKHKNTKITGNILIELLKHTDEEITHAKVNHNTCYQLLMKHQKSKLNMNTFDQNKSTPLHYAARYGGAEKTLDLLRAGASMACRNRFDTLPVEDIDANTLETHLNECLETNVEGNIDKENLMAIFNYKTLMPPKLVENCDSNKVITDAEAADVLISTEIQQLASETQVISYMSKSPELKHLLKHPVITSFLYLKWHRIRWFFYTNLAFYVTFCLSLILYILLIYSNRNDRPEVVYTLSALLGISFTLLLLREVFQIGVSVKTYFLNLENWLELFLIVLTAIILFHKSSSDDLKKQVSAFAILLAAFELVILIGQHPKMSTNIVMLRTVSFNFFKFLLWYSILILAFSLSFYTLFKDSSESNPEAVTNSTDDEEPDFFVDPGISLFKTIVMLTGEFDAGSINFDVYPVTSHIIFMLFVFMIAIILFNLLNGLAVSDTQLIKSNSELVGHIARIEHIAYIESMFLGNILPKSILNLFHKCCCCLPLYVTSRFIIPGVLIKRVCLFPYFLKDYRMMVYPNKNARIALTNSEYSDEETNGCIVTTCTNIYLDKQTAKRTKQLIRIKKEILEKERDEHRISERQERVIEQQQRYIEELKKEQQIILNKLDYIITNMSVNV